jgi:hypothetical protein
MANLLKCCCCGATHTPATNGLKITYKPHRIIATCPICGVRGPHAVLNTKEQAHGTR